MTVMEKSLVERLKEEYITVPMGVIPAGQRLDFNLYIPVNGSLVLYAAAGSVFELKALRSVRYRYNETLTLYAKRNDPAQLRYYEANLSRILRDSQIQMPAKARIYYDVASNLVKEVLDDPRSGTTVKRSKEAVHSVVDLILSQREAFFNLVRITSHDYYTYTHSVNVCTLAVGLAKRLGIKSHSDFMTLGLGALLHDVGKCAIDLHILNKPGSLTEAEWKVMRTHPQCGSDLLSTPDRAAAPLPAGLRDGDAALLNQSEVSKDTLAAIEQHHEACNGRGYPRGLTEKEIHLFAKIVKIVDIYDALTTNRCYQKARTPFQAIKCLQESHLTAIDQKIFREFILLLGFGPTR